MGRPGQFQAIERIWQAIERREQIFSLQLPPRYGKSNVARALASICIANGITPFVLWITTSIILRDQAIAAEDSLKFEQRFGYRRPFRGETVSSLIQGYKPSPNSLIVTATIQMFLGEREVDEYSPETLTHRGNLLKLIKQIEATGKRLLIIADECHTMSQRKPYGHFLGECKEAGAIVVTMTGTFHREDNEPIFGAIETNLGCEVKVRYKRTEVTPGKPMIEVYHDTKDILSYEPHFSVSLAEAWAQNVLCQVEAKWIDVHGVDGVDFEEKSLAAMSEAEARRQLWRIVRHKVVIERGVELFVRSLGQFKDLDQCFRGIVFCGHDRDEDEEDNKHCRDIEREIRKQDHELTVRIVTGADSGASALIKEFREGHLCDVLIVKQMGGVGLDVEELKVALDLSTIRTEVAVTQRWLRIATPHDLSKIGRLIAPADILAKKLFELIVQNNGGSYVARPTISSAKVDEYPAKPGPEDAPSIFLTTDALWHSTNDDKLRELRDERIKKIVDNIMKGAPILVGRYTEPYLAEIIERDFPPLSDSSVEGATPDTPRDIGQYRKQLRDAIGDRVKDIVQVSYPYKKVPDEVYADARAAEWTLLKKRAGLEGKYASKELKDVTDESDLERLSKVAEARYGEISSYRTAP